MAEESIPQSNSEIELEAMRRREAHSARETYTENEKALIGTLYDQLRNALDQRDRLAAEVERLKAERWADPADIDPKVLACARQYLVEHREDDHGPVLLIRDLYDIVAQKRGAASAERTRIRKELLAAFPEHVTFFDDGPGEGLVSVPGEPETGTWAITEESFRALLDRIVPGEG